MLHQVMIKAAGLGTRMQPFSHQIPKVFLPFFGVPVIQWVLEGLLDASVSSFVINVHHHASWMQSELKKLTSTLNCNIRISDESSQLLGSAGGIRQAAIQGPFFIANADVLTQVDWKKLAHCHARLRKLHGVSLTLAIHPGKIGSSYTEILFDPKEELILGLDAVREGRPFYTGVGILEPEACAYIPEHGVSDFVTSILKPAILQKKAGCYFSEENWYDFGSVQTWRDAHFQWMKNFEHGFSWGKRWDLRMQAQFRHAPGIWSDREGDFSKQWKAPCYWGLGVNPPQFLGPEAILYGEGEIRNYLSGIGHCGIWKDLGCD